MHAYSGIVWLYTLFLCLCSYIADLREYLNVKNGYMLHMICNLCSYPSNVQTVIRLSKHEGE